MIIKKQELGSLPYNHFTWYVESHKPKFVGIDPENQIVLLLQADGHELDLIRNKFNNIPITMITYGRICTWRGSMAQFIYDNL
jgi:hypothetical protein